MPEESDALLVEQVDEFADLVLCLCNRETVAGNDDDLARVAEHDRDVLGASGLDGAIFAAASTC